MTAEVSDWVVVMRQIFAGLRGPALGLLVFAIGAEAAPWVRDSNTWVEFQPDGPGSVRRVFELCFFDRLDLTAQIGGHCDLPVRSCSP